MIRSRTFLTFREDFIIGKKIGCGKYGIVYLGEVKSEKRKVAIKTNKSRFSEKESKSLLFESQMFETLGSNANIVNFLWKCLSDFSTTGYAWLITEFCEHGDLKVNAFSHFSELFSICPVFHKKIKTEVKPCEIKGKSN